MDQQRTSRDHGKNDRFSRKREELILRLKRSGYLRSGAVERAMLEVPRECFVSHLMEREAYSDRPLPIGGGQTISAPHMVAEMCEVAELSSGMKILEIGAGSGYNAAVMSRLVHPGTVHTTEVVSALIETAKGNLERAGIGNVIVHESDGSLGLKKEAPYDRIMVTCASPGIPKPLTDQLSPGGMLIIPVGNLYLQTLTLVRKDENGALHRDKRMGCVFVPMKGKFGFS